MRRSGKSKGYQRGADLTVIACRPERQLRLLQPSWGSGWNPIAAWSASSRPTWSPEKVSEEAYGSPIRVWLCHEPPKPASGTSLRISPAKRASGRGDSAAGGRHATTPVGYSCRTLHSIRDPDFAGTIPSHVIDLQRPLPAPACESCTHLLGVSNWEQKSRSGQAGNSE
jgi:hypothetical protein